MLPDALKDPPEGFVIDSRGEDGFEILIENRRAWIGWLLLIVFLSVPLGFLLKDFFSNPSPLDLDSSPGLAIGVLSLFLTLAILAFLDNILMGSRWKFHLNEQFLVEYERALFIPRHTRLERDLIGEIRLVMTDDEGGENWRLWAIADGKKRPLLSPNFSSDDLRWLGNVVAEWANVPLTETRPNYAALTPDFLVRNRKKAGFCLLAPGLLLFGFFIHHFYTTPPNGSMAAPIFCFFGGFILVALGLNLLIFHNGVQKSEDKDFESLESEGKRDRISRYPRTVWGRFLVAGVWIGVIVGGLALLRTGFMTLFNGMRSSNWPTAEGFIDSSGVDAKWDEENSSKIYAWEVRYRFSVNGSSFQGENARFGRIWGPEYFARKTARKYRTGDKVVVYFKGDDPTLSVLEPGIHLSTLGVFMITLLFGVLLTCAGFGLLAEMFRREKRLAQSPNLSALR